MKTETQKKRLVVIDGNAIIHRAYHAIPPLTVKDGTVVNAVYGFTSTLLKVLDDLTPDYLIVCFDVAGKTFRDELYTEYKATRVKADQDLYDQIPLVHDLVKSFNIPIFTKEGFEADDIIGTITHNETIRKTVSDIIIVTGDMDILQLVDAYTSVYELRKGLSDIVMFTPEKVQEKYGFGPEMIVDYKALRGDVSDNIPGVPGIGEKTATDIITTIGTIDTLYKKLHDPSSPLTEILKPGVIKKLEAGEENAYLSKKLATIDRSVPDIHIDLSACTVGQWNPEIVQDTFRRFEFFSLLKRVPGMNKEGVSKDNPKKTSRKKIPPPITVTGGRYSEILKTLQKESFLGIRHILDGKEPLNSSLTHLLLSTRDVCYIFPWQQLSSEQKDLLGAIYHNKHTTLIGHDLKETIKMLRILNIQVECRLFDLMIASYVTNSSTRAHDLPSLIERELHHTLTESEPQGNLFGADTETETELLHHMWELYNRFSTLIQKTNDEELFQRIEMELIPVLADMELTGVAIDTATLHELSKDAAQTINDLTKKIWQEAGEEFNVASSAQLRDVLFDKLHLPTDGIKKGKTGYSTAASELEKLHGLHPIITLIEEHRELSKLQNTYIDVLPTLIHPKTGRIHTHFNQAVASTGRLSSSDPNLQNIPIRTPLGQKIRSTFIAADGYSLIAADYSQMELRIVASLAHDTKMIDIFNKHEDIHRATAAAINNVTPENVTKEMRYAAKEVNFGVLYGMGAYGLAWRAGIPQWQAKQFIDTYFSKFSGVKSYVDDTIAFAKKYGYVETLFKRRRYIPEITSTNYQLRSAGERMAVNMPVQGTLADISKLAMIRVFHHLKETYDHTDARLLLQVHDELVLEVKQGLEERIGKEIQKIMEDVVSLAVPVIVEWHAGKRWGELK